MVFFCNYGFSQNDNKHTIYASPFFSGLVTENYVSYGGGINLSYEYRIKKVSLYAGYLLGKYNYEGIEYYYNNLYSGTSSYNGPVVGAKYWFESPIYKNIFATVELGTGYLGLINGSRHIEGAIATMGCSVGKYINNFTFSGYFGMLVLPELEDVMGIISLNVGYRF